MTKWEYNTIFVKQGTDGLQDLNFFGERGWELVTSAVKYGHNQLDDEYYVTGHHYVMKKEIEEGKGGTGSWWKSTLSKE